MLKSVWLISQVSRGEQLIFRTQEVIAHVLYLQLTISVCLNLLYYMFWRGLERYGVNGMFAGVIPPAQLFWFAHVTINLNYAINIGMMVALAIHYFVDEFDGYFCAWIRCVTRSKPFELVFRRWRFLGEIQILHIWFSMILVALLVTSAAMGLVTAAAVF